MGMFTKSEVEAMRDRDIERRRSNAEEARRIYFPQSTCPWCDPVYVDSTTIVIEPWTIGDNVMQDWVQNGAKS